MNWFSTVLKVVICFIILTDLTKVLLSFVWMKCSNIEEVSLWVEGGEARVQAWGFPRHPSKYPRRLKHLSLGMPRKASHLYSTIIGMSRFLFCSHDMHKFLERLLCSFFPFLLCTMLVWYSPWFIYRMLIAIHLYLLSMAL